MDPNATLAELRTLVRAILTAPESDASDDADSMAEHFQALDQWLSRGGFRPADWTTAEPTTVDILCDALTGTPTQVRRHDAHAEQVPDSGIVYAVPMV